MSASKKKNVQSMAQLAKIAGCSTMTVSYALRNHPKVSRDTAKRIQALALEHGYVKNPLVSALMATRRRPGRASAETLALLTKFDEPVFAWKRRRVFYSDLLDGLQSRAAELGFRLEEFPTHTPNAPRAARLNQILKTRGIRGVILMPGGGWDRPFPDIDHRQLCIVAAAFHSRQTHIHRSASDYNAGMALCIEEAVRLGYRRIGLAMNHRLDPEVRHAFSGRYFVWREQQPPHHHIPLIPGDSPVISPETFNTWITHTNPDCVLCPTRELAVVAESLPKKRRPGILLIPTRGDTHFSGLDARPFDVGRTTINLLARELFLNHIGPPPVPEVVLVESRWQEGHTLPARNPN